MVGSFFNYPGEKSENEGLIFLPNWTESNWSKLTEYTQQRRFNEKDIVIELGATERTLQLVIAGTLHVMIPTRNDGAVKRVATIDAGSVVGEQSFVDARPRSARVVAASDGEFLELSYDRFQAFCARETELGRDILMDLARILSARLRNTTMMLSKKI